MKGRKPKSKNLRLVEGNREKRAINMNEPEYANGVSCPKSLDKKGKAEWKRIAKDLEARGLLTKVDRAMFAAYCFSWSVLERAMEVYQEDPNPNVKTDRGGEKTNPALVVAGTAIQNVKAISSVFGFAPGDRQRIKVDQAEETLDDILNG